MFSLCPTTNGKLVDWAIQEVPSNMAKKSKKNDTEQAAIGAQYKRQNLCFLPFWYQMQVTYYNKSKLSADDVKSYETITSKLNLVET